MGREGKEAGSISPASLDLGDGIWARSDLGPPAQRPAWQAVVFVQGRTGWGWKQTWNARFGQTTMFTTFFLHTYAWRISFIK
jgi:hypothetical protein